MQKAGRQPLRHLDVSLFLLGLAGLAALSAQSPSPPDPPPQTLDEFKAAATRVLTETGVPGAAVALVRADGVEWVGGFGHADRERQTPVTADTHFRVGSISKTFVAIALVQLYEDDVVDLNAPVAEIAPEIAIDNPWHHTDPVRVIHLLQHTAGFDDMHFNERYLAEGEAERRLEQVLQINPASRRVRWRPGTRMSYSNPGYTVAGYLIEKLTDAPYEDYIKREIFDPLGMSTSSFRLTEEDEAQLARGYADSEPQSVGFPRIYLRPAGNMHSSAREMAQFVRMLLGWGDLDYTSIVDPEYLGTMEQPRTTYASMAGLRNGYGTGIASLLTLPYPLLGHGGGIDGFLSQYAYSPGRDVGYVVLLNSTGSRAAEARNRLSSLAIGYLKRDVEPPPKPEVSLNPEILDTYVGYYHEAAPRNQFAWPILFLISGQSIEHDGTSLFTSNLLGVRDRLIPVSDTLFRRDADVDASIVFTRDDEGTMVMAGQNLYAERRPRWRVELVRIPMLAALAALASALPTAIVWLIHRHRARPQGFWLLKAAVFASPLMPLLPAVGLASISGRDWGRVNAATVGLFVATLMVPAMAVIVAELSHQAWRKGANRWLVVYSLLIAYAMAALTAYLGWHDLLGVRLWRY